MRSRSKLVAHAVPTPSRPGGVELDCASFTAAIRILTSDCFARAIFHVIQLLAALFDPTRTSKCVASFIIRVSDCCTTAASEYRSVHLALGCRNRNRSPG